MIVVKPGGNASDLSTATTTTTATSATTDTAEAAASSCQRCAFLCFSFSSVVFLINTRRNIPTLSERSLTPNGNIPCITAPVPFCSIILPLRITFKISIGFDETSCLSQGSRPEYASALSPGALGVFSSKIQVKHCQQILR